MPRVSFVLLAFSASLITAPLFAQTNSSSSLIAASVPMPVTGAPGSAAVTVPPPPPAGRSERFSSVAIGVKVGALGAGVEAAVPVAQHFNLRAGSNFFSYSDTLTSSGVNYTANLNFRSAETSLDWFPWSRSFHISPGALVYNGNKITGNALIPAGESFTLNGTSYTSSASDPVHGSGSINFAKAAPKLTIGWGNLVPRNGHHFSFPTELGFAYVGDPKVALNFSGTVCDTQYQGCESIAGDSTVQANIAAEQQKFAKDASYARFFPILSTGFAYRF